MMSFEYPRENFRFINLESEDVVKLSVGSSSKGNQNKYLLRSTGEFIKEQFAYQNVVWKDYQVEYLSCILAEQMNLKNVWVLEQEIVQLSNNRMGVASRDFSNKYEWLPFAHISEIYDYRNKKLSVKSRFDLFVQVIDELFQVDITEYLAVMVLLDYLLGNEDRHYNNIGIVRNLVTGSYAPAPLFDFGLGLFEHDLRYRGCNLFAAKARMEGKPFSHDLGEAVDMLFGSCYRAVAERLCCSLKLPDKALFPSQLAYEYMENCLLELQFHMRR